MSLNMGELQHSKLNSAVSDDHGHKILEGLTVYGLSTWVDPGIRAGGFTASIF